ncbi:MAG TPA: hypothetical protein P5077_00035 [bacterium]|nr:hypothetical protein [bacterium]
MSLLAGFFLNPLFLLAVVVFLGSRFIRHRSAALKLVLFNALTILCLFALFDLLAAVLLLPEQARFRTMDRFTHHGLQPLVDRETKWGDISTPYRVRTNDLGMVDAAMRTVPPKSEKRRVLLLGDSFVEGVGLPWEDTLAGMLSADLAPRGVEVLNAGVASYSPKLYYLRMQQVLAAGLQIDEVFLFLDIGDIQDEVVYDYFVPDKEPIDPLMNRAMIFFSHYSWIYRSWHERFFTRQENPKYEYGPYWEGIKGYHRVRARWMYDTTEFERWGKEGLEKATLHTEKLLALLKEHGIKATLSIHPWPEHVRQQISHSMHETHWKIFALEHGVELIDLFPLFINERPAEEVIAEYFIAGDIHWGRAGHRLVADEVLKRIEKNEP